MKKKQQITHAGGWFIGNLPLGCQLCMKGMKIVYFSDSSCNHPPRCSWYCPISEERRKSNNHYIDEIPIPNTDSIETAIEKISNEAKVIDAQGMSLTGGDPLSNPSKIDWTIAIISGMKIEKGRDFHIHLYTCGEIFNEDVARRLDTAGLDAIRFHPAKDNFYKIEFAIGKRYKVGAEVPVIPTEENHQYLLELADFLESIGADYLNLNEFEMVETNQQSLQRRGFKLEKNTMATVKDSAEYAKKFVEELGKTTLDIHFCPAALKDGVQIRNRYLRRANNIKRPFDEISDDGTLLFLRLKGAIQEIRELQEILINESGMPKNMIELHPNKGYLDLPSFLAEDEDFLDFLLDFNITGGIYEILPFRENEEIYQIMEFTPLEHLKD